jgi:hypothetical protein
LTFNPLTNTAQVLIQNLTERQSICYITNYIYWLRISLIDTNRNYLMGNGALGAPQIFSFGLLALPSVRRQYPALAPLATLHSDSYTLVAQLRHRKSWGRKLGDIGEEQKGLQVATGL